MSDVHVPHLEEPEPEDNPAPAPASDVRRPHARSIGTILLEVVLISTGVFLGLAGEQWRESVHHHELATASLERFHTEIVANRRAVAAVKDYHVTTQANLRQYFAADAATRRQMNFLQGFQPAVFEHAAWDLSLATQSLAYIDPSLGFGLAAIYNAQQQYSDKTTGLLYAMYARAPTAPENQDAFLRSVQVYYGDITLAEPKLIAMYDALLPEIEHALGQPSGSPE